MKRLVSVGSFGAKIAIVITATVGGTALVGSSVFASLTATATNGTAQSVTSGTLQLTQGSLATGFTAGFTSAVSALAQGDTINRFIDVKNGGTLAGSILTKMTLGLTSSATTLLTSSSTNGLQVVITECVAGYTLGGTCTAGESTVLTTTSANALLTTPSALTLGDGDYAAVNGVAHLKFAITLPATLNETTPNGVPPTGGIQGASTNLTWTFTETQRAGQNTVA